MSWFDGYIPDTCRGCFYKSAKGWNEREDISCDDRCDFFLEMFPVLTEHGEMDWEKFDNLHAPNPVWHVQK